MTNSLFDPVISRRKLLVAGGAVAGASVLLNGKAPLVRSAPAKLWSDPSTWGGSLPGSGDVAEISGKVILDKDVTVGGVVVPQGAALIFHSKRSVELRSSGNVIVNGLLQMKPAAQRKNHRLTFIGVNEAAYQGGGGDVKASDVGLWVKGRGALRLVGSEKRSWMRAAGTVKKGARSIKLRGKPSGWRVGDTVVLTPTGRPNSRSTHEDYDVAKIEAIRENVVRLSRKTQHRHPKVRVGRGRVYTAEVLNLSRNVEISGRRNGRAHILVGSRRRQFVRNVAIRHMGPRKKAGNATSGVLGRYGLHFHMCRGGSRGSRVQGVVVRDCGNHSFVPHLSHGVKFMSCISHNTFNNAYWWDGPLDHSHGPKNRPPSNDILFERCVASLVKTDPPIRGFRLGGFTLGTGVRNRCRGCVAVGVRGNADAAGFAWPEGAGGVWGFADCVTHNNAQQGIFTWQNTDKVHVVKDFVSYHNGANGVSHGAYRNGYRYVDSILYGNRKAAIQVHSASHAKHTQRFVNLLCDAAGLSDFAVVTAKHQLPSRRHTKFIDCTFKGYRKAAIGVVYQSRREPSDPTRFDVIDCNFSDKAFFLADKINGQSVVRVQDRKHGALRLRRRDKGGRLVRRWNARVKRIRRFA